MSSPPPPLPATTASASTRDLVLIGGGHAHVHLLKSSGLEPLQSALRSHNIRITLISRDALTPYSGMLPGYVAGHYTEKEMHIDLEALCAWSGVTFVRGEAVGIDYFFDDDDDNDDDAEKEGHGGKRGRVHLAGGDYPPIMYDALGIDVGSSPGGFFASSSSALPPPEPSIITPVKPISSFSARYASLSARLRENAASYSAEQPFVLLVVGGGAGGVEVALAAHHHLGTVLAKALAETASVASIEGSSNGKRGKKESNTKSKDATSGGGALKVILATRGETVLGGHNPKVRKIFRRILKERGVEVRYYADAVGVDPPSKDGGGEDGGQQEQADGKGMSTLTLSDASQPPLHFHECLWCTSARAPPFLSASTPFDTTDGGFLLVDDTYQCTSHPGVFASGDCANMPLHPRPKAGVFAVRAGPIITENIVNFLLEKELRHHEPQKEFLGLISTGDRYAIMSRGRWAMEGKYLWTLKDKIDRKWMEGYQKLPPSKKPPTTK